MKHKLVRDAMKKVPTLEQWPVVLLVVVAMFLGFFGWVALETVRQAVPAALQVSASLNRFDETVRKFNSDLGGGTDRIVESVELVGQKLDRLPEMERKLDAMPIELWRAMGSPVLTADDGKEKVFRGGG